MDRKPAEIDWEGDSKEVVSRFPEDVKKNLGYNLRRLQNGLRPVCDTRPMPSIGRGVYELKDADQRTWYRVLYLARIENVIFVLHCFEKDTRKTDRRDIKVAQDRLAAVRKRIQQERKNEKGSQ